MHDDDHPLASAYHKLLVWDIMRKPAVTRLADRALNPLIGKSLVVYASKPAVAGRAAAACGSRRKCMPQPEHLAGARQLAGTTSRVPDVAGHPVR